MFVQPPPTPSLRAPRYREKNYRDSHEEEKSGCGQVGDQTNQKGPPARIGGEQTTPIFARGVFLSHEVVGMIQSHQQHDQAAQPVEGRNPGRPLLHRLSAQDGLGEVEGDDSADRQFERDPEHCTEKNAPARLESVFPVLAE